MTGRRLAAPVAHALSAKEPTVHALVSLTLAVLGAVTSTSAVTYVPPVDAPIVDHFRPPACTWCPGNRGIDYATSPGTAVRAAAPGVVTFAGSVGGDRYVTIAHADGLRTTYAYLASIAVAAGDRVGQGHAIGISGASLHFGVRRGDTYLDPEQLFGGARLVARLIPLDGRRPAGRGAAVAR